MKIIFDSQFVNFTIADLPCRMEKSTDRIRAPILKNSRNGTVMEIISNQNRNLWTPFNMNSRKVSA